MPKNEVTVPVLIRSKIAAYGYTSVVETDTEYDVEYVYAVKGNDRIELDQLAVLRTMRMSRLEKLLDEKLSK